MRIMFLVLAGLTFSCIKPEEPPPNVIPKDTMAQVLIDIHLAESKIAVRNFTPDTAQMLYEIHRREIYDKYKISQERFTESFEYYTRNVDQLDKIYEVVVDSLSLRESRGKLD